MAPPPTTTSAAARRESDGVVAGDDGRPLNFRNGSSTGAEPVAMTMFFAVRCVVAGRAGPTGVGDPGDTSIVVGETKDAAPVTTVILRALASWATPPVSLATMSVLRFMSAGGRLRRSRA
jgi:hypothetical protein